MNVVYLHSFSWRSKDNMKKDREKFLSAVYLIIRDSEGKILLQRRQGTKLWPGYLGLPAGHIDSLENAYDALVREAKEELSIDISIDDIIDTFVVNRRNKSLLPYYDVYFEVSKYEGNIVINEPLKCSELVWVDINDLPSDMIGFEVEAIRNNLNGIKFSVIDVNNDK